MDEDSRGAQSRETFLIAMYGQMWANIDRHILVVWQAAGSLVGAAALLVGVSRELLSVSLAALLIVIGGAWLIGHVIDAHFWFARNLAIITNIERNLLTAADVKLVHPYFRTNREHLPLLDHLVLQAWLGGGLVVLALGVHLKMVVAPAWKAGHFMFSLGVEGALPWAVLPVLAILLLSFASNQKSKLKQFHQLSPGPERLR
jgi:hypothetical protein